MKKNYKSIAVLAAALTCAQFAHAQAITIKSGDTIAKLATAAKGKKITVRLVSGEELTGTVKEATSEIIQLSELAGKEFSDALIDVTKVSAIIIRTK